jgi:hypothetical protein
MATHAYADANGKDSEKLLHLRWQLDLVNDVHLGGDHVEGDQDLELFIQRKLEPRVAQLLPASHRQAAVHSGEHERGDCHADQDAKREEDGVARRIVTDLARGMVRLCGSLVVGGLVVVAARAQPAEDTAQSIVAQPVATSDVAATAARAALVASGAVTAANRSVRAAPHVGRVAREPIVAGLYGQRVQKDALDARRTVWARGWGTKVRWGREVR